MVKKSITSILLGLAGLTGTVLADTKNIYGGFISMCDPETVKVSSTKDQISLFASCYDDNTKVLNKNVTSKLDLSRCLTNNNGQLSWHNNGSLARVGCGNCSLAYIAPSNFTANLHCDCEVAYAVPFTPQDINLNDGIHVHNGQLVCYEYEGTQYQPLPVSNSTHSP